MFKSLMRNSVFALAAVAGLAAAVPVANARDFGEPDIIYAEDARPGHRIDGRRVHRDILSQREVASVLRRSGYRDIREIDLMGDRYRVIAVRRNGAVVKLRVSARSGQILSEVRIGWVRHRPVDDDFSFHPRPRHHDRGGVTIEFGWGAVR